MKTTLILFFLCFYSIAWGQRINEVNDSLKLEMFKIAFDNFSTSPHFIVYKAKNDKTNEVREVCQQGPYFLYKAINKNKAEVINWNEQVVRFDSFVLTDTLFYETFDSTVMERVEKIRIKDIELPSFESSKYNLIDSLYGKLLLDKAERILELRKEISAIGYRKDNVEKYDSLDAIRMDNYKAIRQLYFEYGVTVPHYYFNHGILTRTGCYAGEFIIDKSFMEKKANP
jgi:hypothetical protein